MKVNGKEDRALQIQGNFASASIFVVVGSKLRLIWNGHMLKIIEKFKKSCVLDDVPKVLKFLARDDIVNKFDDSSGFHQLALQDFSKGLTCFKFGQSRFKFNSCPFGVPSIPHHFQATNSVGVNYLRMLGFKAFLYLDDRLTISEFPKPGQAPRTAWLMCAIMIALGGFVSRKKSTFLPSKEIEFLGFEISTRSETIRLPEVKWEKFCKRGREILTRSRILPKEIERFRGKACSFFLVAPMMRIFIRNMSAWIAEANRGLIDKDGQKPLTLELKEEITRWITKKGITTTKKWVGPEFHRVKLVTAVDNEKADLVIATDSSGYSGGIVLDEEEISFYWKDDEAKLPIHCKEALVILRALQIYAKKFFRKTILLECDNMAVCLTFENGARDKVLNKIITDCHDLAFENNCNLRIIWVPTDKQRADAPSRIISVAEAELAPDIYNKLQIKLGWKFSLDGMATRFNRKTKDFISRDYDSKAIATNFFAFTGFAAYTTFVFPPQTVLTSTVIHLLDRGKTADWVVLMRMRWTWPECYPLLKNNRNVIFITCSGKNNIFIPAKKRSHLGFFTVGDFDKKIVFAAHSPRFAELKNRFFDL